MGDPYRYGRWASSVQWVRHIVASHPVGSQVEVHYALADPSDAVLQAGVDGMDLFVAICMLPFNLVALAFRIPLIQVVRRRMHTARAGSAGTPDHGESVQAFSPWRPLYSGVVVAGVLALIGALVIGYRFGGVPPLSAMELTWGVILGGGALAHLLHWRRARKRTEPGPAVVTEG